MTQESQLPNSIQEAMERTPEAFEPQNAQGVNATIQYNFTGDEAGSWVVKVAGGKCTVEQGQTDATTLTIDAPSDVWLKVLRGELDGATALANDQYSYSGNIAILMQMGRWFGSLMASAGVRSIRDAMRLTPEAFRPDRAAGASATIQYQLSGEEPGNWIVRIADGKCTVEEGQAESPTVTISAPSEVWLKILRRELDGTTAFMSGLFTFTGDMGVLMQIESWFGMT